MDIEEQYDKIYRYCYFKLGQQSIAEDITQEAFLRFWESTSYRNEGKALHYLYTIARNLCVDEYRKQGREKCISNIFREKESEINIEEIRENKADISNSEEQLLTKIVLKQALEELSEQDRELILLRFVNQVPINVISKLTGLSRFTIYRRINNAIARLKRNLRREDFV